MKFEFGDLHKFLVSSGIVLISLSLLVPWLFLKEPTGTVYSEADFSKLEENSRAFVALRQTQITWVTKFLPVISSAFAFAGILLCFFGLTRWNRIQKIIDEKHIISLELDKMKLQDMSQPEIDEKRQREAFEEKQSASGPNTKSDFLSSYLITEAAVSSLVSQALKQTHTVTREKKVGRTYIDVIAEPKNTNDKRSTVYTIEVKFRRRKPQYSEIKSGYLQSINAAQSLGSISRNPVQSRLVIGYAADAWDKVRFNEMRSRLFDEFPEHARDHRIFGTSVAQLQDISPETFASQMELS